MEVAFQSDVGKLRSHNEDSGGVFLNPNGKILAIVADGMGGHQAGDVASQMTIQAMAKKWSSIEDLETAHAIETWLREQIVEVNQLLFDHAKNNTQCQGMGTTLVAVVCTEQFITFAHVGDSRAYLMDKEVLTQKTSDHSLVNELVRSGQITEIEAENHPRRNVLLRALGTEEEVKIDIETIHWDEGSYVLLCSDGLTNKVTKNEIQEVLQQDLPLTEKASYFITLANKRGGEDNISVAMVKNVFTESDGDEIDR
ncbi:MAG: Stp1/IreP family PP2C-type Ser/Thr phosphatase [Bacillaceae bacterium]|nr:Stp1/IreP family PP2C-type Ser/Thr phosphatase [Bacillaceae bacterium]